MIFNDHVNDLFNQINVRSKSKEYQIPLKKCKEVDPTTYNLISTAMGSLDEAAEFINNKFDCKTKELKKIKELKDHLYFSAVYFDNLISSKSYNSGNNDYFYLLGALAYYFCDQIGSSKVMLSFVKENVDVHGGGFEKLLWIILSNKLNSNNFPRLEKFDQKISKIIKGFLLFKKNGTLPDFDIYRDLNDEVLYNGTDREAFLCELFVALLKFKIFSSAVYLLPNYTKLPLQFWVDKLSNGNYISELWPSQKLLGKKGLFNGKSGVIQLPTSSGKTTSIWILLQSQFKRHSETNAIVIAPYRALCKDITKDLSFYFENDPIVSVFDFSTKNSINLSRHNTVFVLTPKRLFSLLRKDSKMLNKVSTIVFDEPHLFDDNSQGIMYELLITTIKKFALPNTQLVLMSAMVFDTTEVNQWINGKSGIEISSNSLKNIRTRKSIAIESVNQDNNKLIFLDLHNPNNERYFIPRAVSQYKLKKLRKERKKRVFPDFDCSEDIAKDIAIDLADCLIHNGSIAILCGQKATVRRVITRIIYLKKHGLIFYNFTKACKNNENKKIEKLIISNFGKDSCYAMAAKLGVFPRSAEIPLGIGSSIEFAFSRKLIGLVVCTSTLAQGMNLPIRYLIILSLYQSMDPLSINTFQNLLESVGTAGKYTEGTVILSDPAVYRSKYKYSIYKQMINNGDIGPCESAFLRLLSPLSFEKFSLSTDEVYELLITKYKDKNKYDSKLKKIRTTIKNKNSNLLNSNLLLNKFDNAIENINKILSVLENYIVNYYSAFRELDPTDIVKGTLGYFQASDDQKKKLVDLVQEIINNVNNLDLQEIEKIAHTNRGIFDVKVLLNLANEKKDDLLNLSSDAEIIELTILDVIKNSKNSIIKKLNNNVLKKICELWINGKSYHEICLECEQQNFVIKKRKTYRKIKLEEIVEICNDFLSYEYSYFIDGLRSVTGEANSTLNLFQKKLKYGLSNRLSILVYELGFSDRCIASKISTKISSEFKELENEDQVIRAIKSHKQKLKKLLLTYPTYFEKILDNICNKKSSDF